LYRRHSISIDFWGLHRFIFLNYTDFGVIAPILF
jgi:hypothetical protein